VRQGVLDHLKERGMNLAQMDVSLTSVQFNGKNADATVSFAPKGQAAGQGMSMAYRLEKQGDKWVVVGRQDVGGAPHGGTPPAAGGAMGGAMPGSPQGSMGAPPAQNPHGGAQMPAPESLPPSGTKK
jgi:hypothetical protein